MRATPWTACLAAVLLAAAPLAARVEGACQYSKAQTFSAALRYLRVDLGYDVIEKDDAAAYLLFRYPAPGRKDVTAQGSIEVIEAGPAVKLFVQLPQAPEYQERMLRDGLLKKLRQEYGEPPQPKLPAKQKPNESDPPKKAANQPK